MLSSVTGSTWKEYPAVWSSVRAGVVSGGGVVSVGAGASEAQAVRSPARVRADRPVKSSFFIENILLLSYYDNTRGGKLGYRGGSNPVTGNDSGLQGRFAKNGLPFCGKSHII